MRVLAIALAACGASKAPAPAGSAIQGSGMRLELDGNRIARITSAETSTFLVPSIIDSHVHLAFWPVADQLAKTGIGGVVDLGAPENAQIQAALHVIAAGPMLTRVDGYPLDSWGADGYGRGCDDTSCVANAIGGKTSVVKIALDENGLDPKLLASAVATAHAKNLKVAVHALTDRSAMLAANANADILAHTPVEPLRAETIAAWKSRAVISTLAAFGGSDTAIANLRALREAGATVLYGTDLGNLRDAGPSASEIALLRRAGLDDAAIIDAMTTVPARYWGMPLGSISVGAEASFFVVKRDPRRDANAVMEPEAVWLRGRRVR